ncbi:MAG: alkaline phosphatase D family protein [Myxococcota bacterium]|nr:alkaline phosphatase D family protein [Myxococcota bacterium]
MRRRELLTYGGVWLVPIGVFGCERGDSAPVCAEPTRSDRFPHGVASADPTESSVRVWTRVESSAEREDVRVIVATDEGLCDVIAESSAPALARDDHTVHVELTGLAPSRTYYYAFELGPERSAIGRTRTTGAADRVRLGFTCCASLAHGWLHTYDALAAQELDAVVHLGDYVYEYENGRYGSLRGYEPAHATITLEDYRLRYGQYRREPPLQALHARHPTIVTWDDHEIANNAWRGGSIEHDEAIFGPYEARREAATRAHAEWIPRAGGAEGERFRRFSWGDLAELFVLDTRMERDPPPRDEVEAAAPGRSILGARQREWLFEGLRASTARWKVIASGVQVSPHAEFWNFDAWDGYADERRLLLELLEREGITGVIVVCGDGHKSFADDLARDPLDPAVYDRATGRGAVAVELMTPAASSPNLFGGEARDFEAWVRSASPHTHFVDAESRGYWTLELAEDRALATLSFVEGIERPTGGDERVAAVFEVRLERSGLVRVR